MFKTVYKSGLVLTNIPYDDFYSDESINKNFGKERLKRRTMYCSIGEDRSLLNFIFGTIDKEINPPTNFRCFFFWTKLIETREDQRFQDFRETLQAPIIVDPKELLYSKLKKYKEAKEPYKPDEVAECIKKVYPDLYNTYKHQSKDFGKKSD